MTIRRSTDGDLEALLAVHRAAFGVQEGPEIVELVDALLHDETASPLLSLVAQAHGTLAGHVLFTAASVQTRDRAPAANLLAPLAVAPQAQGKGVGSRLVNAGLEQLRASGVELVFVLGHPGYYPRFGFRPAAALGLVAPYPIPDKNAGAWMVAELRPGVAGTVRGTVQCAAALRDPIYWTQ